MNAKVYVLLDGFGCPSWRQNPTGETMRLTRIGKASLPSVGAFPFAYFCDNGHFSIVIGEITFHNFFVRSFNIFYCYIE